MTKSEIEEKRKKLVYGLQVQGMMHTIQQWGLGKNVDENVLKQAFDVLDGVFLEKYYSDFIRHIKRGTKFYRARILEPDNFSEIDKGIGYDENRIYGFNYIESKEPPLEYTSDQRNSDKDTIALYLAENEATACAEVKPEIRQLISVAEFEAIEDFEVLDFSKRKGFSDELVKFDEYYCTDIKTLVEKFVFLFSKPAYSNSKEEYKVTQKIVEHYRKKGIQGFCYQSFYTEGKNYTFFDELMKKFVWKDSRIVLNYAVTNRFITLDKLEGFSDIYSRKDFAEEISSEDRKQMRENITEIMKIKE